MVIVQSVVSPLCVCVSNVCFYLPGVTECQRRGLRCSEQGDFLPAQVDFLSSRWRCFNSDGVELDWTLSDKPLSDDECTGEISTNQRSALVTVSYDKWCLFSV